MKGNLRARAQTLPAHLSRWGEGRVQDENPGVLVESTPRQRSRFKLTRAKKGTQSRAQPRATRPHLMPPPPRPRPPGGWRGCAVRMATYALSRARFPLPAR